MSAQTRFAQAVQDPASALPQGLTSKGGRNDPLRFAVYRNNVHVSLVNALTKGFPVVRALVGEEFFTAMARVFVGQTKPSSPMLFQYGENFPDFIAEFPPAASLPYLSDVARLECAWTRAYHAADDPILTVDALADLQPPRPRRRRNGLAPRGRRIRPRHNGRRHRWRRCNGIGQRCGFRPRLRPCRADLAGPLQAFERG